MDFKKIPQTRMVSRRCNLYKILPYDYTPPLPLAENSPIFVEVSIVGDNKAPKVTGAGNKPLVFVDVLLFHATPKKIINLFFFSFLILLLC